MKMTLNRRVMHSLARSLRQQVEGVQLLLVAELIAQKQMAQEQMAQELMAKGQEATRWVGLVLVERCYLSL